jgi:hypothetical protein
MDVLFSLLFDHWSPELLLGPLLLLMTRRSGDAVWGLAICLLFLPFLAVGPLHPRWWSVPISLLAFVGWALAGKWILMTGNWC